MENRILNFVTALTAGAMLAACSGTDKGTAPSVGNISIADDDAFTSEIASRTDDRSYVILHEDDNTLISDVGKIVEYDGVYYIADMFSSRKVVAFDKTGQPVGHFGQVGQGPGEYRFPLEIFADQTGVYVITSGPMKLIHYAPDGSFIDEKRTHLNIESVARLDDGNFLAVMGRNYSDSIVPSAMLCLLDPSLRPLEFQLPVALNPDPNAGSYHTSNPLRKTTDGFFFYKAPADTLYHLDRQGKLIGKTIFDFGDMEIAPEAKEDFVKFYEQQSPTPYLMFSDSPMAISDSLWIFDAAQGGSDKHNCLIAVNPLTGKSGVSHIKEGSSIFQPANPLFVNSDGYVVSYLVDFQEEMCPDFGQLPDSVRTALDNGEKVLMLSKIK